MAPCVVLKMYVPVEVELRVTVSPTVVGAPAAVSSVTVNGPDAAVPEAVPDDRTCQDQLGGTSGDGLLLATRGQPASRPP